MDKVKVDMAIHAHQREKGQLTMPQQLPRLSTARLCLPTTLGSIGGGQEAYYWLVTTFACLQRELK